MGVFWWRKYVSSNQAFQQIVEATGGETSPFYGKGWFGGTMFAIIVGFIIIGGIKSIGKVTERLVPFMGLVYVISCLLIILSNFDQIPDAVFKVFESAFSFDATTGGVWVQ